MEDNLIVSVGKRNPQFNRQYYKYYNRVISESRLKTSWIVAVKNAIASGLNMRVHSWRNFASNVPFCRTEEAGEKEQCILLMTPGRRAYHYSEGLMHSLLPRDIGDDIWVTLDKCISEILRTAGLVSQGEKRTWENLNSTFWDRKIPQVSQSKAVRGCVKENAAWWFCTCIRLTSLHTQVWSLKTHGINISTALSYAWRKFCRKTVETKSCSNPYLHYRLTTSDKFSTFIPLKSFRGNGHPRWLRTLKTSGAEKPGSDFSVEKVKVAQLCPTLCNPMEFSRPEYWSGKPFPSPVDLPNPGIIPGSPGWQVDSLPTKLSGNLSVLRGRH